MKKPYIVPESKLYTVNFKENIAASSLMLAGEAEVSGGAVIRFTSSAEGCREFYTDTNAAPVDPGITTFSGYYHELDTKYPEYYQKCFRHIF